MVHTILINNMKEILFNNIDKLHTTVMGIDRIKKNLNLSDVDVVMYTKESVKNEKSIVEKNGKNYYVYLNDNVFTINSYSYTIITAHKVK